MCVASSGYTHPTYTWLDVTLDQQVTEGSRDSLPLLPAQLLVLKLLCVLQCWKRKLLNRLQLRGERGERETEALKCSLTEC